MRHQRIKDARLRRGWSQAQLAQISGYSQPYISQVERGAVQAEDALEVLAAILGLDERGQEARRGGGTRQPSISELDQDPLPSTTGTPSSNVPLQQRVWQRPAVSGDFTWMTHMAADAVLLVAADIVGRGATAAVKAAYLRGWLEGFQSQLVVTPELTSVASRLEACLQAARIEAAWFMALLQHSRRHTATYSALASGFPPPLLLVGAPPSTRPSLVPGRPGEIHRTSLTAPWRLAMASDGLLQRLGSGSESRGVAALRGWLAGPARDRDPAVFLDAPDAQTDDELFAEIRWEGWDDVVQLVVEEHGSRHRALSLVETFVARLGGERAGRAAASAVAEAVDNAARHAYAGAGPVQLSMREEGDRVRVQIEDSGRADLGRTPGDGLKLMRHHATSVDRWYGKSGGTIVSLAFEKEPQDAEERNA